MSGLGLRVVAIGRNEFRDRFTVGRDYVAAALANAAEEFGEFAIGIGGGYGLFHGGSNSSDITYYTGNENSRLAP